MCFYLNSNSKKLIATEDYAPDSEHVYHTRISNNRGRSYKLKALIKSDSYTKIPQIHFRKFPLFNSINSIFYYLRNSNK